MGTLCVEGEGRERLEYRMLEGSCESGEVLGYLDALAQNAEQEHKPCVVVLDNALFHTAGVVREREEDWKARGLTLYRLPAYCPQLNLIEGVWRRLKGFLMPRRFYDSVAELKPGCIARSASAGSRGDSMFTWRYLVVPFSSFCFPLPVTGT
jgi:putative transposase